MSDSELFKKNYEKLRDEDLIALWNKRKSLVREAIIPLEQELNNRKLEYSQPDNNEIPYQDIDLIKNKNKNVESDIRELKKEKLDDHTIAQKLSEKYNFHESNILKLIQSYRNKGNKNLFLGFLLALAAIVRIFLILNDYRGTMFWDVIVFLVSSIGSIALIYSGIYLKKKYRKYKVKN